MVMEDTDGEGSAAAFWGKVNAAIHARAKISGVITNGVVRDLDKLHEYYFAIMAGSVGVSHGHVHVSDFDCPVTVHGMKVNPGDMIHADQHGAVVIPAEVLDELPKAIRTLGETEAIVLDVVQEPLSGFSDLKKAWREFEQARVK